MRIQQAVADLHPVHRSRPDLPLDLSPEQCASLKNLYIKIDLGILDCLGNVLGVGGFEEVRKHSIELRVPAGTIRMIDIDTLIIAKEAMGRPHDLISVVHLRELKKRLSDV